MYSIVLSESTSVDSIPLKIDFLDSFENLDTSVLEIILETDEFLGFKNEDFENDDFLGFRHFDLYTDLRQWKSPFLG